MADQLADLPPVILPVDLNDDYRLLLLELILADQLADLPPLVVACSGEEWQFHISNVRAHIGRSTGRSTPQLVACSSKQWQFHISTVRVHIGR